MRCLLRKWGRQFENFKNRPRGAVVGCSPCLVMGTSATQNSDQQGKRSRGPFIIATAMAAKANWFAAAAGSGTQKSINTSVLPTATDYMFVSVAAAGSHTPIAIGKTLKSFILSTRVWIIVPATDNRSDNQ